ncbi:MAG TPA: ATP-binding cassette domain-containing protein, partial [Treponemataceae bacterium]|nr:ATP-binding cassette domain-containing protein [Treponemataceae bacterium]
MKIQLDTLIKRYPQKNILNGISFEFQSGKIYCLLGENGAGKSTLAKIIAGKIKPDAGEIRINKKTVCFSCPADAQKHKIQMVAQNPLISESLTVYENSMLGNEGSKKSMHILNALVCKDKNMLGLTPPSLVRYGHQLSAPERFITSLLSSLIAQPDFLILDEPGSTLNMAQRKSLYSYLQKRANEGLGILIISHNKKECMVIADIVLELKNGTIQKENTRFIHTKPSHLTHIKNLDTQTNTVLKIHNATARPVNQTALFNISFAVQSKSITVICGERENGLETLENIITGMCQIKKSSARFMLFEKTVIKLTPRLLRQEKVAIIPFDRNYRASNPNLTILQMLSVHYTGKIKGQKTYAQKIIDTAKVSIHLEDKVSTLSGGMLQRLIVCRELATKPRFLILSSPTRGMDTKSEHEFSSLVIKLVKNGTTILL